MRFSTKTEEEVQHGGFLEDGIYHYEVIYSKDEIGRKSGKEYIDLHLRVWDHAGTEHTVYTNLALIKLLKHFCDVNNMQDAYSAGNLPDHACMGKSGGYVIIGFEAEKPNRDGGTYKAKNVVKDYVLAHKDSALEPLKEKNGFKDDDIPF